MRVSFFYAVLRAIYDHIINIIQLLLRGAVPKVRVSFFGLFRVKATPGDL